MSIKSLKTRFLYLVQFSFVLGIIKRFPKNLIKIYCDRKYKYLIYLEDYEIEFI